MHRKFIIKKVQSILDKATPQNEVEAEETIYEVLMLHFLCLLNKDFRKELFQTLISPATFNLGDEDWHKDLIVLTAINFNCIAYIEDSKTGHKDFSEISGFEFSLEIIDLVYEFCCKTIQELQDNPDRKPTEGFKKAQEAGPSPNEYYPRYFHSIFYNFFDIIFKENHPKEFEWCIKKYQNISRYQVNEVQKYLLLEHPLYSGAFNNES